MTTIMRSIVASVAVAVLLPAPLSAGSEKTWISIADGRWRLNGRVTYPGTQAEGLLMNVRMVNAVFEDIHRPGFDAEENTSEFTAKIPEYVAHGIRAFTISLQGGFPGYEGAANSAFRSDGSLRRDYMKRVRRVIEACDRNGAAVILGCYYQRQDQVLTDEEAVRTGVTNAVRWLGESGFTNVVLEIANEFNHSGFDHPILKKPEGQVELIKLAKSIAPELLVSTSGLGNGRLPDSVADASDFLLIHFNGTTLDDIPKRIQALKKYGKPIVCNEDQKYGEQAAEAARLSVEHGASWGFMHEKVNQHFPFHFKGGIDDPTVYAKLKQLTSPAPDGEETAPLTPVAGFSEEEMRQGFVGLFDGKSLAGWQGATEHWAAENDSLVFIWKGAARSKEELLGLKLMSTREYSDFILRFDCKLPEGSNNGVAIRAPLEGDPAFAGMEIQIQDTHYYRKLKEYEVFGSVYGVAPAKVGHLNPNGQWNTEEILCQDKHVKVTLNGTVIVDIDLDSVGKRMIDGQNHPGLKREKGYIGFLGHTGRVEFRNIRIKELSTEKASEEEGYFPPPESQGGWRKLDTPDEIERIAGMDPDKLLELKDWLMASDKRNFAAVVIRNGYIVLEVERGNSSKTDARRVASVSKAICATVLAIASERSQRGQMPQEMSFDDPVFDFVPWAMPLSDPRKAKITVKQLLNHTSGICPEATGARNDGTWQYILGHSGDERTAKLAFDPGTACGYSTHALAHAALVCEYVTGIPYDEFAIEALFKPIGCEHWWFQYYDGGEEIGRHPSHGMGMPARDLARIAYCMIHNGRWKDKQVIPNWFVEQTAAPTHNVRGLEMRFKISAETFSHGWQLPSRLREARGMPEDARYKPGSGGQLIAFVPSLDLVVTRQTGSSGPWEYEKYLRRACAAVVRKAE
ncbi:MAG: family 16 glycoside hydrolase [Sedimentisphaerales bacterium]